VVRISLFGAMRRHEARFALLFAGQKGHQTLLLRLSAVLRNALVLCGKFISHWNFFHKSTGPEFQPSLPRGQVVVHGAMAGLDLQHVLRGHDELG
jgi:hypothetical protein